MADRSRRRHLSLLALLFWAAPARGQSIRQIPLNVAAGTIDRPFLPSGERFDFLIRAASELREFRGQYRLAGAAAATVPDAWVRSDPTQSRDATLRIAPLDPGGSYEFTFTLVRRPTGNEGRLIEARVQDVLRDLLRSAPESPIDSLAVAAAPRLAAALDTIVPHAAAAPTFALAGRAEPVVAALSLRGIDGIQADYRRQLDVVRRLRTEYEAARTTLAAAPTLRSAVAGIGAGLTRRGGFAELEAPLEACRTVLRIEAANPPPALAVESDQLDALAALKGFDAVAGACLGILRDVRLPQYRSLGVTGTAAVADLFAPCRSRLEAFRSELERLISLGRKRDGAVGQAAGDIRRGLDTGVTLSTTVTATFATAPASRRSGVAIGIGAIAAHVPCSADGSCIRVVPALTVSVPLAEPLSVEAGLSLASTETSGRTRHLFWFAGGLAGLSIRLGSRPQRIGAGAIVLRRDEPGKNGGYTVGWYVGLTAFDLRI